MFENKNKEIKILQLYDDINCSDYDSDDDVNNDKIELAKFINENLNYMTPEEMKHIILKVNKLQGEKKLKYELLKFELKYYKPDPQNMDIDTFTQKAISLLTRYQSKSGGFRLEDQIWKIHKKNSIKYSILENEVIFENSINKTNYYDNETKKYIKRVANLLNGLSHNIKVTSKNIEFYKDKIIWILIKCTKN